MDKRGFHQILSDLGLSQVEAARLLSVNARTVRRWAENPAEMSGSAEQALLAWYRLHRLGVPWRPDGVDTVVGNDEELADQIARHRSHAIQLDDLLERVKARGGPTAPWVVDMDKHVATLGSMRVGFYPLLNGGFSPSTYRRTDREPDIHRDRELLEDAYACIALAIAAQRKQKRKK